MIAETPFSWPNLVQNQLPFAILIVLLGLAGYKEAWYFGHYVVRIVAAKDAEIARLGKEIETIKKEREEREEQVRRDSDVEIARLKEERERERTRAERYESLVMRSVESNREIVELVAAVTKRVQG